MAYMRTLARMSQTNIVSFLMTLICYIGLQSLQGEEYMHINGNSVSFGRRVLPFLPLALFDYFTLKM